MFLFICLTFSPILILFQKKEQGQVLDRIIHSSTEVSKEYPNPMIVWQFYPLPKHGELAWVREELPDNGSFKYHPNVIRIEDYLSVKLNHKVHVMNTIDVLQRPDGSTYTKVRETFGQKIKL
ncbi:MAG: hypothetical protein V4686_00305 [Patescibacteria group bacterium]